MTDTHADILAVMTYMADVLDNTGSWGQPPSLHSLYRGGGTLTTRPIPIPDDVWYDRPPAQVLSAVAVGFADANAELAPVVSCDLYGLALCAEAWTVITEDKNVARHAEALARQHRLGTHPQRIEARHVVAVTIDGSRYLVISPRGGHGPTDRLHDAPGPGARQIDGNIPDALDRMVTAARRVHTGSCATCAP